MRIGYRTRFVALLLAIWLLLGTLTLVQAQGSDRSLQSPERITSPPLAFGRGGQGVRVSSFPTQAQETHCQPLTLPDQTTVAPTIAQAAPALNTPLTQIEDAPLLREATFLLGEGDRLAAAGDLEGAREKWLESAELYAQTDDKLATADAYMRIGDSYAYDFASLVQLAQDPAKFNEVLVYYHTALLLAADVYERLIRKELTFDEAVLAEAEALYEEAIALFDAGNCQQAAPLLTRARELYAAQSFGSGELRVIILQVRCASLRGDMLAAMPLLLDALTIATTLPLGSSTSQQYLRGVEQFEQGDFQNAERNLSAVRTATEGQDDSDYASTTHNLANVHAALGDYLVAEPLYREALALFIAADNEYTPYNRAATHHNLGNIGVLTGRYEMALTEYTLARAQWQGIGDPFREVYTMSGMAIALMEQGDYTSALALLQEAMAQYERLPPDAELEGDLLNNIGRIYFGQGRYLDALDLLEQSLALREQLSNPIKRVESLNNIAGVRLNLGEIAAALATYDEVIQFAEQHELPHLADRTLVNQSNVLIKQGAYQQALATLLQVQPRIIERGEQTYATVISTTIGTTYFAIGDEANAQRFLQSGMQSADQLGTLELSAGTRDQLGQLLRSDDCLAQAQTIFAHVGNLSAYASTQNSRALLALEVGDAATALPLVEEALATAEMTGNQLLAVETGLLLGSTYLMQESWDAAAEQLTTTYDLAVAQGDQRIAAAAQALLSFGAAQTEAWDAADVHITRAIDHVEQLQAGLTVSALKTFFFDDFADIYVWAATVAAVRDDLEASFYRLEQARARALLDQFTNAGIDVTAENSDPTLRAEAQQQRLALAAMREQRNELYAAPVRDPASIQQLETIIAAREAAYADLRTQIAVQAADPTALATNNVATISEIQARLDPDTTLVSYFMAPQDDFVAAFVISADAFSLRPITTTAAEIRAAIDTFRASFNAPNLRNAPPPDTSQLYDWLIAPLQDQLTTSRLLIVPHTDLHHLPFVALTNGETFLGEDHVLSNLPSASSLRFLTTSDTPPQSAFVVGNPQTADFGLPVLQHAETEAETVAQLFEATLLTGAAATEEAAIANTTQDIWHIAAHGKYNANNPLFSTLYLAQGADEDGRLDVHEIYQLDLATQLVVLSACETQVGVSSRGDEVVALNRAFLQAGAPSVIATLWQVDDAATAQLMDAFYSYLKNGSGAAQALQLAQRDLQMTYAHPYYWAGFVLTGEGGAILADVAPLPTPSHRTWLIAAILFTIPLGVLATRFMRRRAASKDASLHNLAQFCQIRSPFFPYTESVQPVKAHTGEAACFGQFELGGVFIASATQFLH